MPGEDLTLTLGFDVDEADLERAIKDQVQGLGMEIETANISLRSLQATLRDMVAPMRELRDLSKELKESFDSARESAKSIRESIASTRLQAGISATGGGVPTSTPGLGGISGLLGGGGGILGSLTTGALGAVGAGAGGLLLGSSLASYAQSLTPGIRALMHGENPFTAISNANAQRAASVRETVQTGGFMAPFQAYAQGASLSEIMNSGITARQLGGAYGMARGIIGGAGQGPLGLMSQVVGGAYGAAGGVDIGGRLSSMLGLGELPGQIAGAEVGRQLGSSAVQQYIQEGMSRYPGYLSTMAGIAAPRQFGMTRGQFGAIQGMAGRFGYGPEQIGAEMGGLFQGFGGGELTTDTLRTAMAYSRAQGVGMGQIGASIGGLLMAGGTAPQDAGARESIMVRVMADAVSTGFGRRLPEFASAVGSGVSVAMAGPGMIRNADMSGLIESVSRVTANVARSRGVGLEAAGRFISPIVGAAGGMMRGLLSGGGDPIAMSMLVNTQRERFGGDMFEMMFGGGGLLEAQSDPFGRGMELMAPMMRNALRSSSTRYGAAVSLQNIFQGLGQEATPEMIRDIVNRGGGAMAAARAEGRDLTDEEMLEILHEIVGTNEENTESTQETMRDIQQSGENIMREQLGEMRNAAQYSWAQLGISAAMARDASTFHRAQIAETRNMTRMMRSSAISDTLIAMNEVRTRAAERGAETGRMDEYIRTLTVGLMDVAGEMGTANWGTTDPEPATELGRTAEVVATSLSRAAVQGSLTSRGAEQIRARAAAGAERARQYQRRNLGAGPESSMETIIAHERQRQATGAARYRSPGQQQGDAGANTRAVRAIVGGNQ